MELESLKMENDLSEKPNVDFVEFERRQRHILNELAMKRDQVEELKKELNEAKIKIHEQSRNLESAKSTIEDHQHNLALALKNTRFLEDTLQTKRDCVSRTHLQQQSAVAERESLRELLQKAELENYNLVRELNELKAQHNCDLAYQKEFVNQDAKIRAKIAELNEAMKRYETDQKGILELTKKMEMCEELQKTVAFYRDEFYKSKNEYKHLEEKFIVANCTAEKFEKLSAESNELFKIPQESQLVIEQWKKATIRLTEQCKNQQDVINNLTETFRIENESNIKLCLLEAETKQQLEDLKKANNVQQEKMKELHKEYTDIAVQTSEVTTPTKTEPIEVLSIE